MKVHSLYIFFFALIVTLFFVMPVNAFTNIQLKSIRNGFELRREQAFDALKGSELVVANLQPPLEPGRTLFARNFSYSLVDFAFKSLWINDQVAEANAALQQNADYYIDNYPAMQDRDNFYWAADEWLRLLEYFGTKGTRKAGLITKETEAKLYKMMWQYNKVFSQLSKAEYKISGTWFIDESENHHIQRFSTYWHFAKYLKDLPEYNGLKYDDGFTSQEHYDAWTIYIKHWIVERARKGLFVEMANEAYGLETLKGAYNFFDFGDNELRCLTKKLLDLYWTTWAEEQIAGVRGGSKNRVYPGKNSKSGKGEFWKMAWYYLGIGNATKLERNLFTLVTSSYRMPLITMDIALDTKGRGNYEIKQRRLGLAIDSFHMNSDYRLRQDNGGLVRYSYCTPDFILGAAHFEARKWQDWTLISSQNRWHGVIFAGNEDARIFPQCSLNNTYRSYNQHWSVQNKGCMITQKLPEGYAWDGEPMRVFFSNAGLKEMVERDGWVFVVAEGAFAAVKCVSKGYKWDSDVDGKWLMCEDELTPIIMQVARKTNFANYKQFQEKILSLPINYNNKLLKYKSIYDDEFNFYADYSQVASVNGKTIDIQPIRVFDSPFIKSIWNSGVVTIQKDKRKLELKFAVK